LDLAAIAKSGAKALGFETRFYAICTPQKADSVFGDIAAWRAQAVVISGPHVIEVQQRMAEHLRRQRLPSVLLDAKVSRRVGFCSLDP